MCVLLCTSLCVPSPLTPSPYADGHSGKSPWTKRELVTADVLKKPIIPVWHSGQYPPQAVMMYLMEKQRIPGGNYSGGYVAANISHEQVAEELAAALQRAGVPRCASARR